MSRRRFSSPSHSRGPRPPRFRGNRGRKKTNNLDIAGFITKSQQPSFHEPIDMTVHRTFADFQLNPVLKGNIDRQGFEKPTPIQDRVFDLIRSGQDVLGIANTGTGKTGAFLIPLLDALMQDASQKILVVAPTRELAVQIHDTFIDLSRGTNRYSVMCIGGTNMRNQVQRLSRQHHAVIGTPGRLNDLKKRGAINFQEFKVVVLDEVDRMLDMGFIHDIRLILKAVPADRQSLFFSATMAKPILTLIEEFSHDLVRVSVKEQETTASVQQEIIGYQLDETKLEVLHEVLNRGEVSKVLIFGRTKHGVKRLMFQLRDKGFRAESIHGNKTQSQRQRALTDFKQNKVNILVATDVAARGLDIDDVTHVINYDVPETYDDYVHRIGRTGRGGKSGTAFTFVKS